MNQNVRIDRETKERLDAGALTTRDRAVLGLADYVEETLGCPVLATPLRQGCRPPVASVKIYEVASRQRDASSEWMDVGFDIAYFPQNPESDGELGGALSALSDGLYQIKSGFGTFQCRRHSATVTDRVGHLTGTLAFYREFEEGGELIRSAQKKLSL